MGFFNSIFGNAKQQEKGSGDNNTRAQFKDKRYFEGELNRINTWIDQDKEDDDALLAKGGHLQPFQYRSSFGILQDKADVLYVLMQPVEKVKIVFEQALDDFLKSWEDPYEPYAELLEVISKAVLLNTNDDHFNLLIDFADKADNQKLSESWQPDALIGYLLNYRKPSRPISKELYVPEIYQDLYNVTQQSKSDALVLMEKYLENWYKPSLV